MAGMPAQQTASEQRVAHSAARPHGVLLREHHHIVFAAVSVSLQNMFNGATAFNADISAWSVGSVTEMQVNGWHAHPADGKRAT